MRDLRRKIQDFDISKDENANTILPKKDANGNSEVQTKNSINENKSSGVAYKVNDDMPELKVKSADERANRRAKRQDRMNRLAQEQNTEDPSKVLVKKEETKSKEKEETSSYRSGISNGFSKASKFEPEPKVEEPKPEVKRPWSQRFETAKPEAVVEAKKTETKAEVKTSISKPYASRFEKKEDVKTTAVDTPQALVSKTERKEERTFMGAKSDGVKQTIEEKSVTENQQKTTYSSRTNSRFSNSMDKFGAQNGQQTDKQKAAKAIGKALNVGSIRNKFAAAEKVSDASVYYLLLRLVKGREAVSSSLQLALSLFLGIDR